MIKVQFDCQFDVAIERQIGQQQGDADTKDDAMQRRKCFQVEWLRTRHRQRVEIDGEWQGKNGDHAGMCQPQKILIEAGLSGDIVECVEAGKQQKSGHRQGMIPSVGLLAEHDQGGEAADRDEDIVQPAGKLVHMASPRIVSRQASSWSPVL